MAITSQGRYSSTISWGDRMKIAFEAAQGFKTIFYVGDFNSFGCKSILIYYLHRGCQPAIVHRDVKTGNILLSLDFKVKIADFELSKIFENDPNICMSSIVKGTFGYIDPEYCITQMLNEKSDVYSFGVVLLARIDNRSTSNCSY
ncbi:hypothetical protein ZOSMA_531G00030 [Zostera marina]|uniref:Protein kinase domain-containing protein n=1 Tax=Zostera marina TaxID=29655 RepID=A0A0K9NXD5_ZOSMR|nr:hypothetical protein ZOSMA_531G00030 [Zostera marina]